MSKITNDVLTRYGRDAL